MTLVERLFDTGTPLYLAGRFGRRADRERRHRIYAALTEAVARLEAARVDVPPGDLELLARSREHAMYALRTMDGLPPELLRALVASARVTAEGEALAFLDTVASKLDAG